MSKLQIVIGALAAFMLNYLTAIGLNAKVLLILLVLVILDFITGIWASYSIDRKSLKSSIATAGFLRKVGIFIIPFTLAYVGKGTGYDTTTFVNTILSFLICSEGYSIIANYYSIRRGERVAEIDAIGIIWSYIQNFLKAKMNVEPLDKKTDLPPQ